ncbi:hypothetical protein WQE_47244 [Paraburkholderia hospita]|uniref:Uncharacterized protein n=1 Tax=Paraburkholderia hospita TaxID=169430 RepID=A0ABN0F5E5_9BURK|nr:hypothetical protein WQE_47244 [Paraburkholderia hospita]
MLLELSCASTVPFALSSLGGNARRQHIAQLDAALIERIDIQARPLGKDAVFVKRGHWPAFTQRTSISGPHRSSAICRF